MSYTTFTVTVANPGSGNKYYLDGALTPTINLAKGATYRFDQSDSSNGPHPLKLSATSDGTHGGGSEYTTGVTYVGTPGQAGAYTEIVVANSAPNPLYYYCQYHSGMGGQANATANTWGALEWSQGNWGAQSDDSAQATGIQSSFNIGSVTDIAASTYDFNFTTAMVNDDYAHPCSTINTTANDVLLTTGVTTARVRQKGITSNTGNAVDTQPSGAVFGDLA